MSKPLIYLVAAGTGGHINAAKALGNYFEKYNFEVFYLTGQRVLDFKLLSKENTLFLPSESIRNRKGKEKIKVLLNNLLAIYMVLDLLTKRKPVAVIGAGGYVCGPTLLAAFFGGIPTYILEQNSVMGMTNRLLAWIANKIFFNFQQTLIPSRLSYKSYCVGNPIREEILNLPFVWPQEEKFRILVVGGSLGAQEINELIIDFVSNVERDDLVIRHQTGINKGQKLQGGLIDYEQLEYIDDMAAEYRWANLIICRAGASTLSELQYVQKPVLLIPYRWATDNHQEKNAFSFKQQVHFPVAVQGVQQLRDDNFRSLLDFINQANKYSESEYRVIVRMNTEQQIYEEVINDI